MRLWSLQGEAVVSALERGGVVRSSASWTDPAFLSAYAWMQRQMTRTVGPPPAPGLSPMWAWAQWHSAHQKKPRLNSRAHFPSGTRAVRLTLEVDPEEVLLSDFHAWHCVLNRHPLHLSEAEDEDFEVRLQAVSGSRSKLSGPLPTSLEAEMKHTWERIFDLTLESEYAFYSRSERSIQACLWEIRTEQVVLFERFIAR